MRRHLFGLLAASLILASTFTSASFSPPPKQQAVTVQTKHVGVRQEPFDNTSTAASTTGLPPHFWKTSKSEVDIEDFRQQHNLIQVDTEPQDAALMYSWPQLLAILTVTLLVDLLIFGGAILDALFLQMFGLGIPKSAPSESGDKRMATVTLSVTTERVLGFDRTDLEGWGIVRLLAAFLFSITWLGLWITGFVISKERGPTGGWIPVATFVLWATGMRASLLCAIPLAFQWISSLVHIIWRWKGTVGSIAFLITDLNGCTPVDGLDFLQQGQRSYSFRIFHTTAFCIGTVFALLEVPRVLLGSRHSVLQHSITLVTFAALVYTCYVADHGMPIVVSGDCMLVEASPRVGFLDSSIRDTWKALSFFLTGL